MRGTTEKSLRVLVVDDNEDTALSLAYLFSLWGDDLRTAYDGPSAVESARTFRPDVIVLDIGLPRMDGFEVARQLRNQPETNRVFLVGSSGYSQPKDRQRAREVGIDHYLVKPFDPWVLEELLGSLRSSPAAAIPA